MNEVSCNYLDQLFDGVSHGKLSVWEKSSRQTTWFDVDDRNTAQAFMLSRAKSDDVYFGWGVQECQPTRGRGNSGGVSALPGLMMDIDLQADASGVHAKNDELPTNLSHVLDVVRELGLPKPTCIRGSGNGAYFDWLFTTPIEIGSDADRARLTSLSRDLQAAIRSAAGRRGWSLDNTADLARLTRLPGTQNHKTMPPKPVTILAGPGKRYDLASLEQAVAFCQPAPLVSGWTGSMTRASAQSGSEVNGTVEAVTAGCRWVRDRIAAAAGLSEPEWYALASIVGNCQDGSQHFHALSKMDARYDADETEAKLQHALTAAGPRKCESIQSEFSSASCHECALNGTIASPISVARTAPKIADLLGRNVLDVETARYVDLTNGQVLTQRQFDDKYADRFKAGPHLTMRKDPRQRKVDRTDYLPGSSEHFVNQGGQAVLNLWRPGHLTAIAGDTQVIDAHLTYLYPETAAREHVLNVLASAVQKPSTKVNHLLVTIGAQGTGKSFLAGLVTEMFGSANVYLAEGTDLCTEWTASLGNRQVVVFEEFGTDHGHQAYESLKRWITEETITVNEKHVPRHLARTPKLMLGYTNRHMPTALGAGDRRFFVYASPAEPKEAAYYARLFSEGKAQAAAFLHSLANRDISTFVATAEPPMTEAKREILEFSRPALVQEIQQMRDSGIYPFTKEVVTSEEVRRALETRVRHTSLLPAAVAFALKQAGAIQLPQMRTGRGNEKVRPWVLENAARWSSASLDDLRAALRIGVPMETDSANDNNIVLSGALIPTA